MSLYLGWLTQWLFERAVKKGFLSPPVGVDAPAETYEPADWRIPPPGKAPRAPRSNKGISASLAQLAEEPLCKEEVARSSRASNLMAPLKGAPEMDWRVIPLLLAALLVLGLGLQTLKPPGPETPVLYGFINDSRAQLFWYYATIQCVREGNSLDGYVWDRNSVMSPVNPFDLQPAVEVTTLGRARSLVHDAPDLRGADPICVQTGGFEGRKHSLLMSLFE